jgi:hypothetical protein
MTPSESATCLKVLSVIAWADGTVSETEHEGLAEFIAAVSEASLETVRSTLDRVKALDEPLLDEVRALRPSILSTLISFAHDMIRAAEGGRATPREMTILRRVVCAALGDERWDEVLAWLEAQEQADARYDALFDYEDDEDDEDGEAAGEADAEAVREPEGQGSAADEA